MEDQVAAPQDFIGPAVHMADADASPAAMFVLTLLPMFMLVPVPTIVAGGIRSEASWSLDTDFSGSTGGTSDGPGGTVTKNQVVVGSLLSSWGVGFGRRPLFIQSNPFLGLSYSPLAMRDQARRGR